MTKKRGVAVLAIVLAMGTTLASTPTFAHRQLSPSHKSYRTPAPPLVATGVATAVPRGGNHRKHPVTGAGGTAPLAGAQPVVSGGAVSGHGTKPSTTNPSTLPATGGAAR